MNRIAARTQRGVASRYAHYHFPFPRYYNRVFISTRVRNNAVRPKNFIIWNFFTLWFFFYMEEGNGYCLTVFATADDYCCGCKIDCQVESSWLVPGAAETS